MREKKRDERIAPGSDDHMAPSTARRLVTHGLIHEAACFEAAKDLDWHSVHELSVFIDLFCLYDDVAALNWNLRSFPQDGSSEFFGLLEDEKFIRNYDAHEHPRAMDAACARLGVALGGNAVIGNSHQVVELCTNSEFLKPVAAFFPREPSEFQRGWEWLRTMGPHENIREKLENDKDVLLGTVFLVRSFLYASLAEVSGMPFVPDLARSSALLPVIVGEKNLRQQIIDRLGAAFHGQPLSDDFGLTRNVTPLAGIVFDRAFPKKANVVPEMARLRNELAPLRARLRTYEDIIQTGTAVDEIAAGRKWSRAFKELEDEFGKGDGIITIDVLLRLAAAGSRILVDPLSPGKWLDALIGQPKEWLSQMINNKPLIEIHRLRKQMPATGRLHHSISRLFNLM